MHRNLLLAAVILFTSAIALAQHQPHEQCGTMHVLEEQLQADPTLANRMAQIEQQMQRIIAQRDAEDSSVIVIPVVFHIVHNGEAIDTGANISVAQIMSQLDVLNEDFRRLNADTVNTRAVFKPIGGDSYIEFCLATIDPNGNSTTGINRINGGRSSWTATQMNGQMKPGTIWNRDYYLNFWIANMGTNQRGYAQFPGGNAATDGVVVDYRYVGRPPFNPNISNYNGGRTATHEVGHWLNLWHIWGDGPCGYSDFVDDTPMAASPNYGCPLTTNSCLDTPIDFPDMVENYMDYTTDDCVNIFTKGQAVRMRAALNGPRVSMKSSLGCQALNLFTYRARIVDSVSGLTVYPGKMRFEGKYFTYDIDSDAAGYIDVHNMVADTYKVYAGAWGYLTKEVSAMMIIDTSTSQILVELNKGYYDDFLFDFGWTATDDAATGIWVRGIPIGTTHQNMPVNPGADVSHDFGEYCYITGNNGGPAHNDDVNEGWVLLTSPVFKTGNMPDPHVRFYRWWVNTGGSGTPDDSLIISITNGTSTETMTVFLGNDPQQGQWVFEEFRIADFVSPTDSMQIMAYTSNWPGSAHLVEAGIDLFIVTDSLVVIPAPIANFNTDHDTICQGSQVHFTNTSLNTPLSFHWEFQGGTPAQSTQRDQVVNYNQAGTFTVKLYVTNPGGTDSMVALDRITVYPVPDLSLQLSFISCFGGEDGQLTVQVTGGTPPYSYQWNNGAITPVAADLKVGTYTIEVTDVYGCQATAAQSLSQPEALLISTTTTADSFGTGAGQAQANVIGGTAPYTFLWSDPAAQTTASVTGLFPGTYTVIVTDSNNCADTAIVTISGPTGIDDDVDGDRLLIFPNPANGSFTVHWPETVTGSVTLEVFDLLGRVVYYQTIEASSGRATVSLPGAADGIYLVRVGTPYQNFTAKIQLHQ